MKLSEAIRKGVKMARPGTGRMFHFGPNGLEACALGAAYLGEFGLSGVEAWQASAELVESHPELAFVQIGRPAFPQSEQRLEAHIWHMNDSDGVSREKIADWLEQLGY